jgi:hypothetical protein
MLGGFEIEGEKNTIPTDNYGNLLFDFPINSDDILNVKLKDYYTITGVTTENINNYTLKINNNLVSLPFDINKFDKLHIKIEKTNEKVKSKIIFQKT